MGEPPSYSTIAVTGEDAFDFLQAQLAADLRPLGSKTDTEDRVAESTANLSAWCNPKGRVISLMRVVKIGDGYTLTLPTDLVEEVVRRLTLFRFRAKVSFAVQAATNDELGITSTMDDWRLDNLRAGIVEILQAQSEQFTPHMLNLDLLGAVSVDKGCYPGQEIVARTHFRGATKRRCLRFECAEPRHR
jgi:folate-binding protein YgfZ